MKRLILVFIGAFAFGTLAPGAALAAPPNIAGNWTVEQSGLNGTATSKITLTQNGNGVVGQNASNGNGFTGTFVTDSQINGNWKGPGGAGWLTVYVSPNGHSFNGEWGYNGRKPNGSFVGNKYLPPSAITAAGKWNITAAGGTSPFAGDMTCKQSGPSTVCDINNIVINGKFRTKDKVRARWTNADKSRAGWFSYWFNGDNNSFNGVWGYGDDTTPPQGRVVGQRAL
ncbi:MAG: hypothetical protein JO359_04635 [Candidatus Eremiobacteraeota bacterium]|nr:hypothetical protein [Candidatus Eremiobacteraeota bacterium]